MKFISVCGVCCLGYIVVSLSACGINTKFDDDDYRPVGASSPLNSRTHTLSEKSPATLDADSESETAAATRYTHPGEKNTSQAPENSPPAKLTPAAATPQMEKSSPSSDNNFISRTINTVFSSRYGDTDTIIKIARTVQIHCDQSRQNSVDNATPLICKYRFPELCGGHAFTVLNSADSQRLIYHDSQLQRNIIDTISADKHSAAGLWDKDDYVSSELLTVNQLINTKSIDNKNLGWIMNVSDTEKAQLGRAYIAAVKDTGKCF